MGFYKVNYSTVPNVPCGVESFAFGTAGWEDEGVPNVPCGVESAKHCLAMLCKHSVPNVPCGVER